MSRYDRGKGKDGEWNQIGKVLTRDWKCAGQKLHRELRNPEEIGIRIELKIGRRGIWY